MAEEDLYTNDGTVDIKKNPANREKTGKWKACRFILGNECCERLAYYGMSTNLVNFLQIQLNQGNVTASNNVTNWQGTCYATPLIGAFLADAYLGRYWIIAIFSIIYALGMGLLTLSASVTGLKSKCDKDVCHPTSATTAVTFLALYLIALGTGSKLYRLQKPGGSPLTRICQVIVASCRKANVKVPADKSLLYETADEECSIQGSRKLESTDELKFFDKAAVETPSDHVKDSPNRWKLCTVTQVEELKSIIRLLPIWATGIIFSCVYSQMSTMFVLQGNTMDPHIGPKFEIPSASLSLFDTVSVIFWAPVYDRIIVPYVRKFTGHERGFTQLQRMGIGLVISIFSMITAGILEVVRLDFIRKNNYYDNKYIPMTIFWQVPQYFLIGCAEVFTFIGQIEFFYDQAPDAMRSLCSALSLTTVSLDNLNRGQLDYFYWLLSVLSLLNFIVYLWIAKWYTYKKATGHVK
ncbi:hypothetical protein LWI28_004911 [Acer negundo]|uniref:Peptide transporter n=1 Tax=Acer negundo TaxID=4023 RepID=A0AAD5I510_ACENE|nr:hypothetical protein LWI28_004911 [Acer negundo]